MIGLRRLLAPLAVCLALCAAGCAKHADSTEPGPSAPPPSTSSDATAAAQAQPPATPATPADAGASPGGVATSAASPAPAATATAEPNLLSRHGGAVLRAYPAADSEPESAAEHGYRGTDAGAQVFVFELAGTAKLTRVAADLPAKADAAKGSTVTFAVSTSGPAAAFSDVGTIVSGASDGVQNANVNGANARWVRVTTTGTVSAMSAFGTFATTVPLARANGTYVEYTKAYDKGAFRASPSDADPWYLQVATAGADGINGVQCYSKREGDAYPGTFDGRTWNWKRGENGDHWIVNDDASLIVGAGESAQYWVRTTTVPTFCAPQAAGNGAKGVLVLERSYAELYPTGTTEAKEAPGYRFSHVAAAIVDQHLLDGASTLILNALCVADDDLNAAQGAMIVKWVEQGHKLMIYDADTCGKPTRYALLPYQFQSDNPGAKGARGDRLIQVEDDSLGSSDKTDKAHFFDPLTYAHNENNQLGDANTVTTQDPHWCGHLFGTNANNVNGFMQMYAPYGKGLIIYDGFDHDDGGQDPHKRVRLLELTQPVPADLPCTQKASLGFLIEPNREGTFVPGQAATLRFPMELLANQGWKGHVTLTTSGDFKAAVTPPSLDVAGGTQPLTVAVSIPANAKAGTYAVIVNGEGGGQSAQATIQFHASVPLVKQLKTQRRIRIYGIHFDVDKATIKPQSEPVIKQIADLMKQNPAFRFRVEGHTDSDGGQAHNQTLSQHRAESVVNDLVKRYHVAKSRLVPQGFGFSKPVAPNTTPAGKALNRRVELFLLSGQ